MFNSFGNIFRLTSFGESHGPGVGGVIDGFPAGIDIDMDFVQKELNRRRPGQSLLTTSRKEPDTVEFLSGIFDGKSTGCPIGFVVWNKNQHSNDYENIKNLFRPSHATILIWKNTASATIAAEDVHQHAKQFRALWPVHLPNLP